MKFYLDTADVSQIREILSLGFLDGVTTNPSIIAKKGRDAFYQTIEEIACLLNDPLYLTRLFQMALKKEYASLQRMDRYPEHWRDYKSHMDGFFAFFQEVQEVMIHFGLVKSSFRTIVPFPSLGEDSYYALEFLHNRLSKQEYYRLGCALFALSKKARFGKTDYASYLENKEAQAQWYSGPLGLGNALASFMGVWFDFEQLVDDLIQQKRLWIGPSVPKDAPKNPVVLEDLKGDLLSRFLDNRSHVVFKGTDKPFIRKIKTLIQSWTVLYSLRPVSAEVLATKEAQMVEEGLALSRIHPSVVVKVPLTEDGLKATYHLTCLGIKTNVTLCFSPTQALLAAKAGATYISPFVGRLDDISQPGIPLIEHIQKIYGNYGFKTQIIAASIRHPEHVLRCALGRADIVTASYSVIKQLFSHPLTQIGLDQFLKDWGEGSKGPGQHV